jgi:hypothetical protein
MLLLVVLAVGAAGSVAPIAGRPELYALHAGPHDQRPWDERTLAPVVGFVRDGLPGDEPVFVLAPRHDPWTWLRYLAYPHALVYLPTSARLDRLRAQLPAGRCHVIVVSAPDAPAPAPDVSAALAARLAVRSAERVLSAPDARMDVYRLAR